MLGNPSTQQVEAENWEFKIIFRLFSELGVRLNFISPCLRKEYLIYVIYNVCVYMKFYITKIKLA